ncbi:LytR family transcriptional regulator [Rothia nasimurium]|uniref:LytR family transcriptional regulator n=1 Tax=Rothia nasimurium TaxID=85336 RepID=A0A4Y9F4U8_9MICC|nr:LCP family protein [Rothia nasimurium]MBF0807769.1 LCP family protein [Rothia nasimurium]TFU23119.1 LytR family transcriptional regulator [Rothia nasimurium]
MSVEAHEEPKKKKSKKALWITLLILLLIPVIAVGGYLFMINKAWNKSETFDNAMPNEDGTVTTPHNDELQALVDQAANATITNESGATLESNVSEGDANGDGILDAVAGGAVTDRPVNTASTDILLLGSDQRSGAEAQVVTGARADTIMVLHIPEDGSAAYLISVMRDTWVNIPGYGSAKVNAGLNYGGVDLQVATIEQLLGIQMDHVAEIDFQGFKALVDTLGGITVDVPLSFTASVPGYSFTAGPQTMSGGEALVFVRERYAFSDGDYQRVRNQRAFLRGVYNELKADGALSSASKLLQVIESVSPYMSVDSGLSPSAIVGIAQPVLANGNTQLVSMTLPNAGTGWSWDGQSIVVLDAAATSALSYALQTDTMPNYIATYGSD